MVNPNLELHVKLIKFEYLSSFSVKWRRIIIKTFCQIWDLQNMKLRLRKKRVNEYILEKKYIEHENEIYPQTWMIISFRIARKLYVSSAYSCTCGVSLWCKAFVYIDRVINIDMYFQNVHACFHKLKEPSNISLVGR